jgi:hypothetical protein
MPLTQNEVGTIRREKCGVHLEAAKIEEEILHQEVDGEDHHHFPWEKLRDGEVHGRCHAIGSVPVGGPDAEGTRRFVG